MNRVTLLGNLGADPEVRTLDSGDKVANFRLATNEKWKDRETGEKKERVEWHSVAVFGPIAGVVEQYVKKGDKVLVEGQLRTRKWQDQSGQDRYTTEVVVSGFKASLEMVGGGSGGGDKAQNQADSYRVSPGYQGGGYGSGPADGGAPAGGAPAGGGFQEDEVPFAPEWRG